VERAALARVAARKRDKDDDNNKYEDEDENFKIKDDDDVRREGENHGRRGVIRDALRVCVRSATVAM
jgi:hypothetical protein